MLKVDAVQTQDRLWAVEQVLRSQRAAAVLCWIDSVEDRWLRRLKLAVAGQSVLLVALRPVKHRKRPSPAALRIALQPTSEGLGLELLKEIGRAHV